MVPPHGEAHGGLKIAWGAHHERRQFRFSERVQHVLGERGRMQKTTCKKEDKSVLRKATRKNRAPFEASSRVHPPSLALPPTTDPIASARVHLGLTLARDTTIISSASRPCSRPVRLSSHSAPRGVASASTFARSATHDTAHRASPCPSSPQPLPSRPHSSSPSHTHTIIAPALAPST